MKITNMEEFGRAIDADEAIETKWYPETDWGETDVTQWTVDHAQRCVEEHKGIPTPEFPHLRTKPKTITLYEFTRLDGINLWQDTPLSGEFKSWATGRTITTELEE